MVRDGLQSALATALRDKGWTVQNAASYLGVSRQRLYSVFANPAPARLWQCAITGMPVCTPELTQAIRLERSRKPQRLRAQGVAFSTPFALAVNDVVVADRTTGIAEEGDEGWIAEIKGQGEQAQLRVRMPGGEDWFSLDEFNTFFMTNGRVITA